MKKCNCKNCVCLAEGNNGEWICDEVNKSIEEVVNCPEGIEEMDLSTFVCIANNRLEAYGSHMNFEMGFDNPKVRVLLTFDEFCKELDKGYGNSEYLQIARLYEDADGRIWYDNEYVA